MVAKPGEDFYRLWSGHKVTMENLKEHMDEGLAQRRAYIESLNCYSLRWIFRMRVLSQLMVRITSLYYNGFNKVNPTVT